MASQDYLELGLSLKFDPSELSKLDSLTEKIKAIAQELNGVTVDKSISRAIEAFAKATNASAKYNTSMINVRKETEKTKKATEKAADASKKWGDSMEQAVVKFSKWLVAGSIIVGIRNSIIEANQTLIEFESSLIDIKKVLPDGADLAPLKEAARTISQEFGVGLIDATQAMAVWARKFKDTKDIIEMTNVSMLAVSATGMSLEQSVTSLSAIMAEWNMQTKDAAHIIDVLNEMGNNYRVTTDDVAAALQKTGSAAKATGLEFEQLTGIVTTGIQTLGVSGDQMGTMWTRVMGRMSGQKVAKDMLESLGIDQNQDMGKMLDDLANKWVNFNDKEKQNVAIALAGTQHWSRFTGVMDNYNTVLEATAKSFFSAGSAQKEMDTVMGTTAKKIEQLKAAWDSYVTTNEFLHGITRGFVEILRSIVDGLSSANAMIAVSIGAIAALGVAYVTTGISIKKAAEAIKVFTATMIKNPWLAVATGILAIGTSLYFMGQKARQAKKEVVDVSLALSDSNKKLENLKTRGSGIQDIVSKMQGVKASMVGLSTSSANYIKLQERYQVLEAGLAKGLGMTNKALQDKINSLGGLEGFMKKQMEWTLIQYNIEIEANNRLAKAEAMRSDAKLKAWNDDIARHKAAIEDAKERKKIAEEAYKSTNIPLLKSWRKQDMIDADKEIESRMRSIENYENFIKERVRSTGFVYFETPKLTMKEFEKIISPNKNTPTPGGEEDTGAIKEYNAKLDDQKGLVDSLAEAYSRLEDAIKNTGKEMNKAMSDALGKTRDIFSIEGMDSIADALDRSVTDWKNISNDINKQLNDNQQKKIEYEQEKIKQADTMAKSKDKDVKATANTNIQTLDNMIKELDKSTEKLKNIKLTAEVGVKGSEEGNTYWNEQITKLQGIANAPYQQMLESKQYAEDMRKAGVDMNSIAGLNANKMILKSQEVLEAKLNEYLDSLKAEDLTGKSLNVINENELAQELVKKAIKDLQNTKVSLKGNVVAKEIQSFLAAVIQGASTEGFLKSISNTVLKTASDKMANRIAKSIEELSEMISSAINTEDLKFTWSSIKNIFSGKTNNEPAGATIGGAYGATSGKTNILSDVSSIWNKMEPNQKASIKQSGANMAVGAMGSYMQQKGASQKTQQLSNVGATIGTIWGPVGTMVGGAIGGMLGGLTEKNKKPSDSFKSQTQGYRDLMAELEAGGEKYKKNWLSKSRRDLEATMIKISQALKTSVDDVANALGSALQADNYQEFLTNWSSSLEDMTKNALINAFISSESYKGLYKNLSDTITKATMDGVLTPEEKAAIKSAGKEVSDLSKDYYDMLAAAGLNKQTGFGGSTSDDTSYTASSSSSIVYNNYVSFDGNIWNMDEADARDLALKMLKYISAEQNR